MIWPLRLITSRISRLCHYFQQRISIPHLFLQPLEFTFLTCAAELAGVCSFPEAEFTLEEEEMNFHPGYYYSFVLDLVLYDTTQNRALSLMIANLQLRDEQQRLLANFHKSVPVFKAFSSGRSIISNLYILTRNTFFWPLWLVGFFSSGSDLSDLFSVHFPNYYLEKTERPTKHIVVQLQNKFIQLASATLRVRTHVGLWSYFLSEYPISSYLVLAACSFAFYFSIFTIHQCVQIVKKVK